MTGAADRRGDLDCIVLAGGLGTRIRPLFPDVPKPMIPVGGRPFLEWVLRSLRAQGVARVTLSVGHLAERIRRAMGDGAALGLEIAYSEEEEPLGTAGAVLRAARALAADRILVVNGDSLALYDLALLRRLHERAAASASIVAVELADTGRYGRLEVDAGGRVRRFTEKATGGPGVVNAGIYLIERGALGSFPGRVPLSLEREVFPELIAQGRSIAAMLVRSDFVDMGTPLGLEEAERFIRAHGDRLGATA